MQDRAETQQCLEKMKQAVSIDCGEGVLEALPLALQPEVLTGFICMYVCMYIK